jgi:hypothetical protein
MRIAVVFISACGSYILGGRVSTCFLIYRPIDHNKLILVIFPPLLIISTAVGAFQNGVSDAGQHVSLSMLVLIHIRR